MKGSVTPERLWSHVSGAMPQPIPAVAMEERMRIKLGHRTDCMGAFNCAFQKGDLDLTRRLLTPYCSMVDGQPGAMAQRVQDLVLNKCIPIDNKMGVEDGDACSRATTIVNAIITAGDDAMPNPIRVCAS